MLSRDADWSVIHEAAKARFQERGQHEEITGFGGTVFVTGPGGVHGCLGGLIFGNNMSNETDVARETVIEALNDLLCKKPDQESRR